MRSQVTQFVSWLGGWVDVDFFSRDFMYFFHAYEVTSWLVGYMSGRCWCQELDENIQFYMFLQQSEFFIFMFRPAGTWMLRSGFRIFQYG